MVSCICITHNRVDFLKKAISYFQAQTYPNKELIILYENDPVTKDFVDAHQSVYNLLEIYESGYSVGTRFFIEPLDVSVTCAYHISDGQEIYLKTSKGQYLCYDYHRVFEVSVPNPSCICILKGLPEKGQFRIHYKDTACFISLNEVAEVLMDTGAQSDIWTVNTLINNQLVVLNSKYIGDHPLESIGWGTRTIHSSESRITFCELIAQNKISLGAKRNLTILLSSGDYICVWDDDDVYPDNRIQDQMAFLEFSKRDGCSLNTEILMHNKTGNRYISPPRSEGWENSLLCKKETFGFYDDLPRKEDTPVLLRLWKERKLAVMDDPYLYTYNIHANNISGNDHFEKMFSQSIKLNSN